MRTAGEIIIDAVVRAAAIKRVIVGIDGTTTFVWESNSPEQIEAAIREAGYELKSSTPSCEDNYVAWMRYFRGGVELCDSCDAGAFRVYRHPANDVNQPSGSSEELELAYMSIETMKNKIAQLEEKEAKWIHEIREALKGASKWLVRIHERRDDLPKSFLDNCDPRPIADKIHELLSQAPEVKP